MTLLSREFTEMIYHDPDFDLSAPRQGSGGLRMWFDNAPDGTDFLDSLMKLTKLKKYTLITILHLLINHLQEYLKVMKFQFQIGAQTYLSF